MTADGQVGSISRQTLAESLVVRAGQFDPEKLTLFGIFRNEMYFSAAFLDHYRALGIEQFLILDDGSDDGTAAYLGQQRDVVVLASPYRYGQKIHFSDSAKADPSRVGPILKSVIPKRFLEGRWALYADADEFLVLPPGFATIRPLIAYLEAKNERAVLSTLVDFYPQVMKASDAAPRPSVVDDLFAGSPYFDAERLIDRDPQSGLARVLSAGASARLFRRFGIRESASFAARWPPALQRLVAWRTPNGPTFKSPLIKWDADVHLRGSHSSNVKPAPDLLLMLAHFKFTDDLSRRITMAQTLRSYASNSRRYDSLADLVAAATRSRKSLLGPTSRRFTDVSDLVAAGLLQGPV